MKKVFASIFAYLLLSINTFSQCNLDFGSTSGGFTFSTVSGIDIVNGASSGANATSTQSFNVWDEASTPINCTTPGVSNDLSFDFEILHAFDIYEVDGVIDQYAGSTHDIIQSTSGLRGSIPMGNSGTNETSVGDVRGYKITVNFANYLSINASDVTVNLTSVNTAGRGFESASVVFLDDSGMPYGTTTYNGYYGSGSSGASTDGSCTAPAPGIPWSTTGTGVYTAGSTGSVLLDPMNTCNAIGGSNGPNDSQDVEAAADAGLNPTDKVSGFVFTVYLEDIAPSSAPGAETSTSTSFTSTLNGVAISSIALPVELISFKARQLNNDVSLNWMTASETNNDYFEIQHSEDGINFTTIGKENGSGTSTISQQYNYIHDDAINGTNYYRLKQVDFDEKFEYSQIVSVDISKRSEVAIQPTLVVSELQITLPEDYRNTSFKIFDATGRIIQDGKLEDFLIEQSISLNLLHSGSYFIRIENKTTQEIFRFVKIN